MANSAQTPIGVDGRSLSILRPEATVSPFPVTNLDTAAADTTGAIDAQAVFIYVEQFQAHMLISGAGTAATANDLPLEPDKLHLFALAPGDKVSLIGSDITGAPGHVWAARSRL